MKTLFTLFASILLATSAMAMELPEEAIDNTPTLELTVDEAVQAGNHGMICASFFTIIAKGADLDGATEDRDLYVERATAALQTSMFYGHLLGFSDAKVLSMFEKSSPELVQRLMNLSEEKFTVVNDYCINYVEVSKKMGIVGE